MWKRAKQILVEKSWVFKNKHAMLGIGKETTRNVAEHIEGQSRS
jgi:hypothetical protein